MALARRVRWVECRVFRLKSGCFANVFDSQACVTGLEGNQAAQMQGIRLVRKFFKYLIINTFSLVQLAGLMELQGPLDKVCIHEWIQQLYEGGAQAAGEKCESECIILTN